MEILKIPLTTPPVFTQHPHPSLPPQAGEGVETPSLARAACGVTSDLAAVFGSLVEWLVVSSRGLACPELVEGGRGSVLAGVA